MRRTILAVLLLTIGASLIATGTVELSVDNPVFDFGTVMEGSFVIHKFVLTNTGDESLTITRVSTSCGCTTTALAKSTLEPGDSVELEAVFDTNGYGGRKVTKGIYVYVNDGTDAALSLRMTGEVKRVADYNITAGDLYLNFYLLIDLRSPDAYAAGHLSGAENIPYEELEGWVEYLPRNFLTIVYDQDGTLGDLAAQWLLDQGFTAAKSLLGGLDGPADTTQPAADYNIDADTLNRISLLLVDLRSPDEYAAGHLFGAVNLPYAELKREIASLPDDSAIVVYDQDGTLGDLAAQWLIVQGFKDTKSLLGGLDGWIEGYGQEFIWPPSETE